MYVFSPSLEVCFGETRDFPNLVLIKKCTQTTMGKNVILWEERYENNTFLTGLKRIPKKRKIPVS